MEREPNGNLFVTVFLFKSLITVVNANIFGVNLEEKKDLALMECSQGLGHTNLPFQRYVGRNQEIRHRKTKT